MRPMNVQIETTLTHCRETARAAGFKPFGRRAAELSVKLDDDGELSYAITVSFEGRYSTRETWKHMGLTGTGATLEAAADAFKKNVQHSATNEHLILRPAKAPVAAKPMSPDRDLDDYDKSQIRASFGRTKSLDDTAAAYGLSTRRTSRICRVKMDGSPRAF